MKHCPGCGRVKNWYAPLCRKCAPPTERPRIPVMQRFWALVEKTPTCWLWKGGIDLGGYGIHWVGDGVSRRAHRLAYEWEHGSIPGNLPLDHLCRVRNCVRPSHLEAVTSAENSFRIRKTHCLRGHPMVVDGNRQRCSVRCSP